MKPSAAVVQLGPWIRGIQNLYDQTMTPKGCVVEAENVLIESDGTVHSRLGYAPVSTNVHSLFRHNGRTFGVFSGTVCELFDDGARSLNFAVDGKVTWGVLNDEPVFTNTTVLARISGTTVKPLGVPEPVVAPAGTISTVSRAYSFVSYDGEEGPLSPLTDGGVGTIPAGVMEVRTYAPPLTVLYEGGSPSYGIGSGLYRCDDMTVGTRTAPTYALGRPAETENKGCMPGGSYVRYWRGRLLVARGRTLYVSDPLRYGLYDRSAGVVRMPATIDFIEPVEGGVFVALRNLGVYFLAGAAPEAWELRVADTVVAQAGASAIVPTALMKLDMQTRPEWVAVWFTNKGFALGLPNGSVNYPQADLLSGLPLGTGSLHFDGVDRLIVLSQ